MADDATDSARWIRRITLLFVTAAALLLFIWFFSAVSTVLLGILAASIVTCTLSPLLGRVPMPRGLGAAFLGLVLVASVSGIILALSLPLAGPIRRGFAAWPQTATVDQMLANWAGRIGIQAKPGEMLNQMGQFIAPTLLLSRGADTALGILLWLAFIFVGSIFLLASPKDVLLTPMMRIIAPAYRSNVDAMLEHLAGKLRWWMIGTLGGMCVVFSASCLGYAIAGVKYFMPLALLAGLAEIVPTVGPACAAVIAFLFAASQGGGAAVGVVITYIIVQSLEAYLILPLIMRGAVQIHPAVTLFSVVLWAKIFGVPGMMLAIPINLTIASAVEFLYVRPRDGRLVEQRAPV
ncbi:MAG TPA: AI-2E family transporter [Humisphaera sp.]|jgi:predicted PurR-regulated permease PerM|nr:AI-2E family transporter [Humisphaera sp.]